MMVVIYIWGHTLSVALLQQGASPSAFRQATNAFSAVLSSLVRASCLREVRGWGEVVA